MCSAPQPHRQCYCLCSAILLAYLKIGGVLFDVLLHTLAELQNPTPLRLHGCSVRLREKTHSERRGGKKGAEGYTDVFIYFWLFPSLITYFYFYLFISFFETGCQDTALAILKFVAIPLPQLLIIDWNYRHEPSCPAHLKC